MPTGPESRRSTLTNVVFLSHSAVESGAEHGRLNGLAAWPSGSPRAVLVVAAEGPLVDRARELGVDVLVTPLPASTRDLRRGERNPRRVFRALLGLLRFSSEATRVLRQQQADVVVAGTIKSLVYGLVAGRRAGAKVVWSLHDRVAPDYFPGAVVPGLRHVLPLLVDGVIVNSEATLATIRPGGTPVLVSSPPIVLDKRDFDAPHDPVRSVVMIGRLAPWKAQDNFLKAFAQVFGGTDVCATVVGGPLFGEHDFERHLQQLVVELGIAAQVRFTGHVADVWAFLADADILVHCSRTPEPFGQVVVQGMWARCAVVAAAPGGPAEIISDGVDGVLTPCGEIGPLVAALTELRDDPALPRRLAERARHSAARFDVALQVPRLRSWLDLLAHDQLPRRQVRRD